MLPLFAAAVCRCLLRFSATCQATRVTLRMHPHSITTRNDGRKMFSLSWKLVTSWYHVIATSERCISHMYMCIAMHFMYRIEDFFITVNTWPVLHTSVGYICTIIVNRTTLCPKIWHKSRSLPFVILDLKRKQTYWAYVGDILSRTILFKFALYEVQMFAQVAHVILVWGLSCRIRAHVGRPLACLSADGLLCVTNCGRMGAVAPWETSENRAISRGYSSCFVYMSSIANAANESHGCRFAVHDNFKCRHRLRAWFRIVLNPYNVVHIRWLCRKSTANAHAQNVRALRLLTHRNTHPVTCTKSYWWRQEFGPIPHWISQRVPPPRHAHLSVVVLCCFFFCLFVSSALELNGKPCKCTAETCALPNWTICRSCLGCRRHQIVCVAVKYRSS